MLNYKMAQKSRTKPANSQHDDQEPKHHKHHHVLRSIPLFLLIIYTITSMQRLLISPHPPPLLLHLDQETKNNLQADHHKQSNNLALCSSLIDGSITDVNTVLCCDRSHERTDVCYMRGKIRTDHNTSTILISGPGLDPESSIRAEIIRPYTRKWEAGIMNTIDELTLRPAPSDSSHTACDVVYAVPGVVFSTGGYTGNVYHEFNDGLIPLYITTERFKGEVVLVVLEYHSWWMTKYGSVVEKMSNYEIVDFRRDRRVHCFSELIVGLKIHGELTIDPHLMPKENKGINDFQALLNQGLTPSNPNHFMQPQVSLSLPLPQEQKPKLTIFIRNKSRVILNLKEVIRACQRVGFNVQILNPKRSTPLSEIYTALSSSQAMLAVHGAAMTHFLFMQSGSILIQIVPLGLDWPAEAYYGEPAKKLGLKYMEYKLTKHESSLSKEYDSHDPVLVNPLVITSKGWSETKKIYLEKQNVRLKIRRFSKVLARAHSHVCDTKVL
ncbi:beta-1,2-xylosyltransferase XYXT1-like [Dioscorea cayenensis subsp. rotundata]|uniref:Beta-1,2-xylosyltransferase XYXT1-like n=1 Tax=Dioscorea cayennensis subsp. rotundata TaxID=55577 RepID=A0AB40BP02_DIOCR|nr:beta-1,2-xylosyltransferase XYXT1-like [Dioscorea cayenensis subsp. rotundata]